MNAPRPPADADSIDDFKPLNAEQAQQLRRSLPLLSPWRVIAAQSVLGAAVALIAAAVTGDVRTGWSAAYGALAVILPAALFARGLASKASQIHPGAAVFGFLLWEMVKIALTVAMLFAAPRWVTALSWPAMLVGLVLTMKVYWLALLKPAAFYRR